MLWPTISDAWSPHRRHRLVDRPRLGSGLSRTCPDTWNTRHQSAVMFHALRLHFALSTFPLNK